MRAFLLNDQNLLCMMKLFVEDPFMAGFFHLNSKLSQKVNSLSKDIKISCITRLEFVLVHRTV